MMKLKLKEITYPREGFVYSNDVLFKNGEFIYAHIGEAIEGDELTQEMAGELIGKLGITHKIEGRKLVELPRKGIEVGDVFENKYGLMSFIFEENEEIFLVLKQIRYALNQNTIEWSFDEYQKDGETIEIMQEEDELGKKIGIYEITHELITEYEEE
jgi:hypothetical protein